MPTPNDETLPLTPPVSSPDSRATHTTCPPEEDREHHAPREERVDNEPLSDVPTNAVDAPAPQQQPSPEADLETGATETVDSPETSVKRMEDVEEALLRDTPAPLSLIDESKESDARLAHSMSATAISPAYPMEYLGYPSDGDRLLPNSTSSFLRPGSKFRGIQQSDRQVYEVQVEMKHVDMQESFLCGYLRIQGLTDDHPTLTTYFEGEIIGNKHTFKTSHPEWGSSEKVDMQHWARFPAWRPLAKQAKSPAFSFKDFAQREHLFMRWKEYFLVPDHKVKTITGASFEGFYYICFNQCTGNVSGIYFHAKSEKYQQLQLDHVDDRGCMGAIEFR